MSETAARPTDAAADAPGPVYAVIPAYNEAGRIGAVVRAVAAAGVLPVVVDDGSQDATAREAAEAGAALVVRHPANRGKGAALATGFQAALGRGGVAVITLDADGQHDPANIPDFLEAFRRTAIPVLIGNRMGDPGDMPLVRRWTNRYMSWLLSREMGQYVPDTQCGYRLFAADVVPHVAVESTGFAAESEVLLRVSARGIRMGSVPIRAIYADEKSKIRPFRDTIRFFRMLRAYRAERRRAGG